MSNKFKTLSRLCTNTLWFASNSINPTRDVFFKNS